MVVNSSSPNMTNTSRRTRSNTKKDTDNQPQNQVNPADEVETQAADADNVPESDTLKEKLDVASKSNSTEGNSAPTQIQVSPEPSAIANHRPVGQNQFEIAGMLTAKRPIGKAVQANEVTFIQSENPTGSMANRPVSATQLQISAMVMNRPVASNEIDDPDLLMGYLD